MQLPELTIKLPDWVNDVLDQSPEIFPDINARMEFVIQLSKKNIEHGTGGPFGAAVFDADGRLIAPGVNMVIPQNCSILHAEMVAIALSQKCIGRFDLSDEGRLGFELYASTEPCAMCFGAIPWSGITHLVCGASKQDAEAIGFDEGPKPDTWISDLNLRGIEVMTGICRKNAAAVLEKYLTSDGLIYNPGKKV